MSVAQAATVKLNKKAITLEVGKSTTLKVTGTKKKVTWSSNKKSVATVSSSGKVTAKKAGTAVITAKVGNKKYTCKVTVKEAVNPLVKNAPFTAIEEKNGKISYVVPKDWKKEILGEQDGSASILFYPENKNGTSGNSNITLTIMKTGMPKYDISLLKTIVTEDLVKQQMAQRGITVDLKDFKQSDYEATLGSALKTEYSLTYNNIEMKQVLYHLSVNNYLFQVTITDVGNEETPDVYTAGEYLLNSITVGK